MCGRYVFYQRPAEVRRQLEESHMPSEEAPEDQDVRLTYNFAPGYHGLVYRAAVPDSGAGAQHRNDGEEEASATQNISPNGMESEKQEETKYKLQAMKWGLIPFWTKRNPDYGSMLKTINCRDDSLIENRGLWNTMKHRKRCVVVCQGFYEWLKKSGGKERIPHFVKRKDGQLMCFAGLWDCVKFEGSDEKLYTYTIITTDSNKQLKFLHDRMPVIFDNGSEALRTWLDPNKSEWNKELQSLLKPYEGELECYPVSKDVGKVGNDSPSFIIPIDSKENKSNILNFFENQKKAAKGKEEKKGIEKAETDVDKKGGKIEHEAGEARDTTDENGTEDNAPLPTSPDSGSKRGVKREREGAGDDATEDSPQRKVARNSAGSSAAEKTTPKSSGKLTRKTRSATSNGSLKTESPSKVTKGNQKITSFFGK